MTVGKRIKELRKKLNLTQSDFAKKISVSPQVVSNWEREYTKPNSEDIQRIATTLDINTEYIYGRTDNPSSELTKVKHPSEPMDLKTFDSIAEINKIIKNTGIEQFGFFDIEKWKNLGPEEIDEIRRHFEWVAQKAKERNEEKE